MMRKIAYFLLQTTTGKNDFSFGLLFYRKVIPYLVVILFVLSVPFLSSSSESTSVLQLFNEGEWQSVIVVPNNPKESELLATTNLQHSLMQVTGKQIRVVDTITDEGLLPIFIKNIERKPIGNSHSEKTILEDSFEIQIDAAGIRIFGQGARGTIYGVSYFLEHYVGFRWFYPDYFPNSLPSNMGIYVPQKKLLEVKYEYVYEKPDFAYRKIGADNSKWSIYNRHNISFAGSEPVVSELVQMNDIGHTFNDFISPAKYFFEPDYFSFYNGKRKHPKQLKRRKKRKLNLVNKDLQQSFTKEVSNYLLKDSDVSLVTIFPEDGLRFDESVNSVSSDGLNHNSYDIKQVNREWNSLGPEKMRVLSKRLTSFYHSILNPLASINQDKMFITGAYGPYLYAPLEVRYPQYIQQNQFADNVLLVMTHLGDHNSPLYQKKTAENKMFVESMNQWKLLYKHLGVYEYYQKASMLGMPFPIIHTIKHDIQYYKDGGVDLFFSQMRRDDIGVNGLNCYVASKLIWDTTTDVDALLENYFQVYYGPARYFIRDYFNLLEQAAQNTDIELAPKYYKSFEKIFNQPLLTSLSEHLKQARSAIQEETDGEQKRLFNSRLKVLETTLGYTKMMMSYFRRIDNYVSYGLSEGRNGEMLAMIEEMAANIQKFIVRNQDYRAIPKSKYVERALTPHLAIKNFQKYYLNNF